MPDVSQKYPKSNLRDTQVLDIEYQIQVSFSTTKYLYNIAGRLVMEEN